MDTISDLLGGFSVALSLTNLIFVVVGVLVGMAIGALPGLGPAPAIALLLPFTYVLSPATAVIMLAGIYYGAYYGGTVSSVILGIPGEAAAVVTTFDGHPMAQQGRAGSALGISIIGSFIGGLVAVVGLVALSPLVAKAAFTMGPPEYTALAGVGLLLVTYLGSKSFFKNVLSLCLGLLVATVGLDTISGAGRFTFGFTDMLSGIDFVAVVMGLFGIGPILHNMEKQTQGSTIGSAIHGFWPTKEERKQSRGAIARGSIIGFLLGMIPGGGGVVSSMASYTAEKRRAKHPERFGQGAIEGVAGPETANNAGSTSAFIPLLTLGIPPNVVLALIFGALLVQGITPGPQLISQHPEIFWGVIASMVIGNLILLLLSRPLLRGFVQMLRIRLGVIASVIVIIVMAGVYSINNSIFDMWIMLAFGVIGYLMSKTGFDPAPLALAMVLGPLLEESFRQSMLLGDGSLTIFITRPVPAVVVTFVLLLLGLRLFRTLRSRDKRLATDDNQQDLTEDEQKGIR